VGLQLDGITACEVGEAELMLGSAAATVKYVVVWKRGDGGQWRLYRDIWNNLPVG
jgi:ketosteroid isomerase-like protein